MQGVQEMIDLVPFLMLLIEIITFDFLLQTQEAVFHHISDEDKVENMHALLTSLGEQCFF